MPDNPTKAHVDNTRLDCERSRLRDELRRKRRELSAEQQHRAADDLLRRVIELDVFRDSRNLSFYMATDGEMDPFPVMDFAWRHDKKCYLPVLAKDNGKTLIFARHTPETRLTTNFFGLMEPPVETGRTIDARDLDLVFLPLVGFDIDGNRLGMGGGYYDRTFQFLLESPRERPRLIGLAHDIQRVGRLEAAPWDIPLDGVVTDRAFYPAGRPA